MQHASACVDRNRGALLLSFKGNAAMISDARPSLGVVGGADAVQQADHGRRGACMVLPNRVEGGGGSQIFWHLLIASMGTIRVRCSFAWRQSSGGGPERGI
jgi:hypothetical protein